MGKPAATVAEPGHARPKNCFKPLRNRSFWNGTYWLLDEATGKLASEGYTVRSNTDGGLYGFFADESRALSYLTEYNIKTKKEALTGTIIPITVRELPELQKEIKENSKKTDAGSDGLIKKSPPAILSSAFMVQGGNNVERLEGQGGVAKAMDALNGLDPVARRANGLPEEGDLMFALAMVKNAGPEYVTAAGETKKSTILMVKAAPPYPTLEDKFAKMTGRGACVVCTDSEAALSSAFPLVKELVEVKAKEKEDKAEARRKLKEEKRTQAPAKPKKEGDINKPRPARKRKAADAGLDDKPLHTSLAQDESVEEIIDVPAF